MEDLNKIAKLPIKVFKKKILSLNNDEIILLLSLLLESNFKTKEEKINVVYKHIMLKLNKFIETG